MDATVALGGGLDSGEGTPPPFAPKTSGCAGACPMPRGAPPPPALAGDARFARFSSLAARAEVAGGALRAFLRQTATPQALLHPYTRPVARRRRARERTRRPGVRPGRG